MRILSLAGISSLLALTLGLQAQEADVPGSSATVQGPAALNIVPIQKPLSAAAPHVSYYGGKVIPNAKVYQVLWGSSGTFLPEVVGPQMGNFYREITRSAHYSMLSEYSTVGLVGAGDGQPGSNQIIGGGTFNGQIVIQPTAANDTAIINENQIGAELRYQIGIGRLPMPDDNTLYMIQFPAEKTIQYAIYVGCSALCGYHFNTKYNNQNVYFGVIPSCESICVPGESSFAKQTVVAAHELFEGVTDSEFGNHTGSISRPLAWIDGVSGEEIGDICAGSHATFVGLDGVSYRVQLEWSNRFSACILTPPVQNDFSIGISPSGRTVSPGGATSYTVSTTTTIGSAQTVSLSASCPAGVTCALSVPSVLTGQSATLNVSVGTSVAAGTYTLTVRATGTSTSHTASTSLTVQASPAYEGYFDSAGCTTISGWAWDQHLPTTPINVDVYDGSTYLATVAANLFRQDLLNAGKGNGYHAFVWNVPQSLKNGLSHSIGVRFGGTQSPLTWSPRTITCPAPSVSIAWVRPSGVTWGPPNTLTVAGYAQNGSGGVQMVWRDLTVNGPWNIVAYQPTPDAYGQWSNTIPTSNYCHDYQVYANYSGVTSAVIFTYYGRSSGYCHEAARVIWMQPQSLAGFGPPGSIVLAGSATGAPSGTVVRLWSRDVTAGSGWSFGGATLPDGGGIWYGAIQGANSSHVYAAYVTYDVITSATCTYSGNSALNWCP